MRKSMQKSAIVMLTMAAFTLSAVGEAQARIGSSRPSSTSSTSSVRSSGFGSSASRIGGGSSMGMQRSSVMNSVRSQPRPAPAPSYAPSYRQAPAPAPSYTQAPAPAPSPSQASPSKRSWVAPAVAGVAAGALAGYALANSNNHSQPAAPAPQYQQQQAPQYQQQAPAYADQAPAPAYAQAAPAPAQAYAPATAPAPAYAAAPQSSGGFGFGSFLLLLVLIGAGVFAYRRYVMSKGDIQADARRTGNAAKASVDAFKSSFNDPAPAASAKPAVDMGKAPSNSASEAELDRVGQDLMASAEQFYKDLQDLNNKGDLTTLRNRIGDDGLFNDLANAVRTRTAPSQTEVVSLQADLVDLSDEGNRFVGSVRYQGLVKEGPYQAAESVDEVFHFVKDKGVLGGWKLAGIEQVEEA